MLGAGAIGSIIGADVARAGHAITLIDMWLAHVEQTRPHGLKVTAAEAGEFTVPVSAVHLGKVAGLRTEFDALFLSVKSYDTCGPQILLPPVISN
jgi:2-dehydropantoate 2-reductase